ncbi:MAG: PIN domain-containing protein [Nanoarchaeota archaeon]
MKQIKQVIIDTNVWMAITEFKLDIFTALERDCDFQYKIAVLQGTIEELRKIVTEQRSKFRQAALLAIGIIETKKINTLPELGDVDDILVEHSKEGDLVLTQDAALKKRLKRPYLTIRQKKKVILVE